jgi:hypothetical protein
MVEVAVNEVPRFCTLLRPEDRDNPLDDLLVSFFRLDTHKPEQLRRD